MSRVRRYFESDKILMFDTCTNCIRDHEAWRYKENRDGDAPGPEPFEDTGDDCCDSLRYLLSIEPTYTAHQPMKAFVSAEHGPREGEMSPDIQRLVRRMRGDGIAGVYTD